MKIGVYISLLCTAVALISHAAVAPRQRYTFDVNQQQKPTQLKAVQLSSWEYLFKFNENRVAKDLTDVDRVLFDFSTTNLSWTSTVTGSVFLATNGQILVPFTPAQLNTNGSFRWRVEAIDDGAGKTLAFGFGTLTIERDWGASTTAAAFVTSTNIDWASVGIYANTLSNGPYRAGTNISFGLTGNGAVTINSSAISAAYTNWVAVSGGNLTLAGAGRSGSNTIGLTTAAIQGAATGAVHGSYVHVNDTSAWVIASITNALNTSIIALNAASNTFEADINALVAVSNAPTLQSVGETSATATGSRYTNGLRLVEFASDGANDYAARFENTQNAGDHTVVKIGAGQLNAAIWASNQTAGVVAKIATDSGDGLIIESTLGKGELLSSTAPLYIESPTASMFVRGAHGANGIALDVGRLGNTNRVKMGSASYALDTTQGNSRIAHVLELNEVTFIGSPAHAFSLKPEDTPADGAVMTYDSAKDTWTNRFTINQSSKSDGDVLVYRSAQGQYTNEAQSGGLPASATNVMVTFAMTNGWDVSGGGGGIHLWGEQLGKIAQTFTSSTETKTTWTNIGTGYQNVTASQWTWNHASNYFTFADADLWVTIDLMILVDMVASRMGEWRVATNAVGATFVFAKQDKYAQANPLIDGHVSFNPNTNDKYIVVFKSLLDTSDVLYPDLIHVNRLIITGHKIIR